MTTTRKPAEEIHASACDVILLACADYGLGNGNAFPALLTDAINTTRRKSTVAPGPILLRDELRFPGIHKWFTPEGSPELRNAGLAAISKLLGKHNPETIAVTVHTYCADYDEAGVEEMLPDLEAAVHFLSENFPKQSVEGFVVYLNGETGASRRVQAVLHLSEVQASRT